MTDKPQSVPVRLVVILGATLAALIVLIEVMVRMLGSSSDRNADHYHELVTAIVDQKEVQHKDLMKALEQQRETTKKLADELVKERKATR